MINPYILYPALWIPVGIAWWYTHKDDPGTDKGGIFAGVLMLIVLTASVLGAYDIFRWTSYEVPESEFYPIYIATCPFGIFTMTGEVSGVHFLFAGSISGQIDQTEKYVVKFMIDNRLKTLLDSLRAPKELQELPKDDSPKNDEDPYFCLLEDDNLITKLSVVTDRLLEPYENSSEVQLMIPVTIKPTKLTYRNMGLV